MFPVLMNTNHPLWQSTMSLHGSLSVEQAAVGEVCVEKKRLYQANCDCVQLTLITSLDNVMFEGENTKTTTAHCSRPSGASRAGIKLSCLGVCRGRGVSSVVHAGTRAGQEGPSIPVRKVSPWVADLGWGCLFAHHWCLQECLGGGDLWSVRDLRGQQASF